MDHQIPHFVIPPSNLRSYLCLRFPGGASLYLGGFLFLPSEECQILDAKKGEADGQKEIGDCHRRSERGGHPVIVLPGVKSHDRPFPGHDRAKKEPGDHPQDLQTISCPGAKPLRQEGDPDLHPGLQNIGRGNYAEKNQEEGVYFQRPVRGGGEKIPQDNVIGDADHHESQAQNAQEPAASDGSFQDPGLAFCSRVHPFPSAKLIAFWPISSPTCFFHQAQTG